MKRSIKTGLSLLGAFALSACTHRVPEDIAYCEQTGEKSFQVVDAEPPHEPLYVLEDGRDDHWYETIVGLVENNKNDDKLAMEVNIRAGTCRVNQPPLLAGDSPVDGGAIYPLILPETPQP